MEKNLLQDLAQRWPELQIMIFVDMHNSHLTEVPCLQSERVPFCHTPAPSGDPHGCPKCRIPQQSLPPNLRPKPEKTQHLPFTDEHQSNGTATLAGGHSLATLLLLLKAVSRASALNIFLWTMRISFYGSIFKKKKKTYSWESAIPKFSMILIQCFRPVWLSLIVVWY